MLNPEQMVEDVKGNLGKLKDLSTFQESSKSSKYKENTAERIQKNKNIAK